MPVYVIEFVIKRTIICFEINIKSLLNAFKRILVNGMDIMVLRHTISIRNFGPCFTAWCQGIGM